VIVTRHRRRRHHPGRIIVPVVVLAALAAALWWPPSHRAIAGGPLKPVFGTLANGGAVVAKPFTFAAEQEKINDRDRTIRSMNAELERQRAAKAEADTRAQNLQHQVEALANQPLPTAAPALPVRAKAAPAFGGAAAAATGTSATHPASDDDKRLAATWAAMEPEKAAAVVQRLPDDAATRVLAAMDTDSAGAIMNALPPNVAARISRAVAQVGTSSGR
jgi:flagellar motility protein MotE (MotC chaperone)